MTQRVRLAGSEQYYKSYAGVGIHPIFRDPQTFCDWVVEQKGWGLGWSLDKDLLGAFEYGPDSCVFLPYKVNTLLAASARTSNGLIGAHRSRGGWCSKVGVNGVDVNLGVFDSAQAAHEAYCEFKELHLQLVADSYRDQLDLRAYQALMAWKFSKKKKKLGVAGSD